VRHIRFTDHVRTKIAVLNAHGFPVTEDMVRLSLRSPDRVEPARGIRKLAQKALDATHVLRVVYVEAGQDILVITLYPGRRTRYEKDPV